MKSNQNGGKIISGTSLYCKNDYVRKYLGSALNSPIYGEEVQNILNHLKQYKANVNLNTDQMAYSSSRSGSISFKMNPEASISAWRHEYQHFLDDIASNFTNSILLFTYDVKKIIELEKRAYQREIETILEFVPIEFQNECIEQIRKDIREMEEYYAGYERFTIDN